MTTETKKLHEHGFQVYATKAGLEILTVSLYEERTALITKIPWADLGIYTVRFSEYEEVEENDTKSS